MSKKIKKELLLLLVSSLCNFGTYIITSFIFALFYEFIEENAVAIMVAQALLGILHTYIFSSWYCGWKYSFGGRADREVINEYKERKFAGPVAEIKELIRNERVFIIMMAVISVVAVIYLPAIFLMGSVYGLSTVINSILGTALSYFFVLVFYFLNIYLYKRRIYKEYYTTDI